MRRHRWLLTGKKARAFFPVAEVNCDVKCWPSECPENTGKIQDNNSVVSFHCNRLNVPLLFNIHVFIALFWMLNHWISGPHRWHTQNETAQLNVTEIIYRSFSMSVCWDRHGFKWKSWCAGVSVYMGSEINSYVGLEIQTHICILTEGLKHEGGRIVETV